MFDHSEDLKKNGSITSLQLEPCNEAQENDRREFERRTMRYVDWRIIPLLSFIYSFALIDRINLGVAYTAGMGVDLKLNIDDRFSIVTCLYFVPYMLLQLPGNIILRRLGARNWLTFTVAAWGSVQLGSGFLNSWGYLVLTRILLGVFEAPFFPALLFIISTWYKRHEVQTRFSVFYLISVTAGGLSPILGYVFSRLDGRGGLAGWRWIFILEGMISVLLSILSWLYIPDFPDKNRFLTREQTELVLQRIELDRGDSVPDPITFEKARVHLLDWRLWAYGVMFLCVTMPNYAQAYFNPLIFKGMGWSKTEALLLSAPPYGPSIISTMIISRISDRKKHRTSFILGAALVCMTGLCITAFAKDNGVRYFGTFLTNMGNSGAIPGILAFSANNVVTQSKRSVQSALIVALGGIGGIMSATVFRAQDAPRYLPGLGVVICSQAILLSVLALTVASLWRQNRLLREGKRGPIEGQPGFFYTL